MTMIEAGAVFVLIVGGAALATFGNPPLAVMAAFFLGSGFSEAAIDRNWPTHEPDGGRADIVAGAFLAGLAVLTR